MSKNMKTAQLYKHIALILILLLSILQACSLSPLQQQTVSDSKRPPYLGVVFSPSEEGLKISQIYPGPFELATYGKTDLDFEHARLLQINDTPVSIDNVQQVISRFSPGQTISLLFQGNNNKLSKLISINVTLSSEFEWSGPIGKLDLIKSDDIRYSYLPVDETNSLIINLINDEINKRQLNSNVNKLYKLFNDWQLRHHGFHTLSRVIFPFKHPDKLIALESHITSPLSNLSENPQIIFEEIAKNLDLQLPHSDNCNENYSWESAIELVSRSNELLNKAFKNFDKTKINSKSNELFYFLTDFFSLYQNQYEPIKSFNALNTSMDLDFNSLLSSSTSLGCLINKNLVISVTNESKNITPYKIKKAVKGKVKKVINKNDLWIVYGSNEDNTYDMSVIDVVYDPDGNDTYLHKKSDAINLKVIIDKDGDDKYLSEDIGPAAGWFGLSFLIDHKGNDIYEGKVAANGTGVMGIGILIDYSGSDKYTGDYFSNGAGIYGTGIIMDLGNDADVYHSASFSQGFGGPRGLGLIYEHNGNDLYRANSPTPSTYGTPAVYLSFSQGVGLGIRHYDSGGIGIIYDKKGSDRYEGGEFSQAGGYYWGLGIIHDDAGHDHYYGNRYSQGFAAHQATGILVDHKGNDNYWSMTAACQGAAWDVAIALLIDIEGNDTYRGDSLCQGAAAMQAMGWLIDLSGVDHYSSNDKSSQGHSGNNTYHFNPDNPVYSWSLLLDAGGDHDFYSNDRKNNQIRQHSEINKEKSAESFIHGLFIDYNDIIN
jgi:hypothetical protein